MNPVDLHDFNAYDDDYNFNQHYVKSIRIRSFSGPLNDSLVAVK